MDWIDRGIYRDGGDWSGTRAGVEAGTVSDHVLVSAAGNGGGLARVAAEHYNLTWVPEEGLDAGGRHGLRAMLTNELLNPAVLDDRRSGPSSTP